MTNENGQNAANCVLSIAGSDPTGGAGLQLDLQVFALHGVHGMAVPTALTSQSTRGVEQVLPAFPNVVEEQLRVLLSDLEPAAIKIGMLASDDIVLRVARILEPYPGPIVLDPVLCASDGTRLLERRAIPNLRSQLIAGATLVTPNLEEAATLSGCTDPLLAAQSLLELGAEAVLVKGGHSDGNPDDLLATASGNQWLRGRRSESGPVHGTGCALSAAIAARLARGGSLLESVQAAKSFVEAAIGNSLEIGQGQKILGLHAAAESLASSDPT